MKQQSPLSLNRQCVEQLLSQTRHNRLAGSRVDSFSRHFLGYPYQSNPLIGSADTPEVFTASFLGFDCVTYIETVLALARASSVDDFIRWLRKIRYEEGRIEWARRNHYMTFWIRNNIREGIIRPISMRAVAALSRDRVLDVVPGLAAQRTHIKYAPKPAMPRLAIYLQSGDLIFFVSTRKNLDVFHTGIIVRDGTGIRLRHASRSQGSVVEQELDTFLKSNRMTGVIVVRPEPAISHASQVTTKTAPFTGKADSSYWESGGVKRRSGM